MKTTTYREWFVSFGRVLQIAKRGFKDAWPGNKDVIVSLIIIGIASSALPYASYWLYSKTISSLAGESIGRMAALWFIGGIIIVSLVGDIFQVLQGWRERQFYHRMTERFMLLYYGKKSEIGISKYENPDFRDLSTKAEDRGIWPLINLLESQFVTMQGTIRLLIAVVIAAAYDWKICVLVLCALIPQFLVDARHGRILWGIFDSETGTRRTFVEYSRHVRYRIPLIELKMFQNARHFIDKMGSLLKEFRISQEHAEKRKYAWSIGAQIISTGLIATAMVLIVMRVIEGTLPLQYFVLMYASIGSLHTALGGVMKSIAQQNEWSLYAGDLYQVIDTSSEADERTGTIKVSDRIPAIEFDKVSFVYPWDSSDRTILKDVSFKIGPGEHVALVGVNGAGKTTLIKLLAGIYVPTSGRILIDGVDLKEIDLESWKHQLAVLSQNFMDYHLPIKDVIALGDTSIPRDDSRVREAAASSGAIGFIQDTPHGFNTIIGKEFAGGIDLSGGQRQRLALARVWYRRGKVVILDEPTASLDAFAEAQIFDEIEKRARTETIVLITHRFSTIKHADRIIVLEKGCIVEQGTHDNLRSNNGVYAQMYDKQAQGYLDTGEAGTTDE